MHDQYWYCNIKWYWNKLQASEHQTYLNGKNQTSSFRRHIKKKTTIKTTTPTTTTILQHNRIKKSFKWDLLNKKIDNVNNANVNDHSQYWRQKKLQHTQKQREASLQLYHTSIDSDELSATQRNSNSDTYIKGKGITQSSNIKHSITFESNAKSLAATATKSSISLTLYFSFKRSSLNQLKENLKNNCISYQTTKSTTDEKKRS